MSAIPTPQAAAPMVGPDGRIARPWLEMVDKVRREAERVGDAEVLAAFAASARTADIADVRGAVDDTEIVAGMSRPATAADIAAVHARIDALELRLSLRGADAFAGRKPITV